MYPIIALAALAILIVLWVVIKLYFHCRKRKMPTPPIEAATTNTSSSIAITEDEGSRQRTLAPSKLPNRRAQTSRKEYNPLQSGLSDDSLKSKNSFGFVPSIRSVAPLSNRGRRGTQNFLMLLDSLDALDDEDSRKARHKHYTAASGSGIEANSSDETASQTLIGKELDKGSDPGRIQLNYIKVQDV